MLFQVSRNAGSFDSAVNSLPQVQGCSGASNRHLLIQQRRLFFRVFDTPERKAIIMLWLGFPRKEGSKDDCYNIFTKMVTRGEFPTNVAEIFPST